MAPWSFVAVTVVGVAGTLIGEHLARPFRFLAKPLASAGFIGLALTLGATETTYGWWVLSALVFGMIGDVMLMGSSRGWFVSGLVAFLIGHVLYVVAFAVAGLAAIASILAAGLAAIAAATVYLWLRPHLPPGMLVPVVAYIVIISTMVAVAVGTTAAGSTALILVGAVAFYLSDLAVARNRFVAPGIINRVWGLPLYYLGQILLAWSVA
jgi:uncharacterized membrane protein YhhN